MNLNLDTTNRFKLINILGGKCRICPEDRPEKLEIDHIYNDGENERTKYGSSEKIYGWYILNKLVDSNEFTEEESRNYIRRMLREASIYESSPGRYNRV